MFVGKPMRFKQHKYKKYVSKTDEQMKTLKTRLHLPNPMHIHALVPQPAMFGVFSPKRKRERSGLDGSQLGARRMEQGSELGGRGRNGWPEIGACSRAACGLELGAAIKCWSWAAPRCGR